MDDVRCKMDDVRDKVKEIKQSFRQMMDGSIAQSMRDKGLNYHLNWGATLPRLQEMAKEIANSQEPIANCQYDLAIALWKENVRECKILATMLMPADQILPEASDKEYDQLCGFHVLTRLFMNHQEPNERGINEYLDQMVAALQGPFSSVRKAAMQSVLRFAELGLVYERMAKSLLKSINLELF